MFSSVNKIQQNNILERMCAHLERQIYIKDKLTTRKSTETQNCQRNPSLDRDIFKILPLSINYYYYCDRDCDVKTKIYYLRVA